MSAYYSISNKDITIYDKNGTCLAILNNVNIKDVVKKYRIADRDVHLTL